MGFVHLQLPGPSLKSMVFPAFHPQAGIRDRYAGSGNCPVKSHVLSFVCLLGPPMVKLRGTEPKLMAWEKLANTCSWCLVLSSLCVWLSCSSILPASSSRWGFHQRDDLLFEVFANAAISLDLCCQRNHLAQPVHRWLVGA